VAAEDAPTHGALSAPARFFNGCFLNAAVILTRRLGSTSAAASHGCRQCRAEGSKLHRRLDLAMPGYVLGGSRFFGWSLDWSSSLAASLVVGDCDRDADTGDVLVRVPASLAGEGIGARRLVLIRGASDSNT
jgi:hypothetical protein